MATPSQHGILDIGNIVALSSTEAEYIAISNVAYLRHLLERIGRPEQSPIVIADDNRGSIE